MEVRDLLTLGDSTESIFCEAKPSDTSYAHQMLIWIRKGGIYLSANSLTGVWQLCRWLVGYHLSTLSLEYALPRGPQQGGILEFASNTASGV